MLEWLQRRSEVAARGKKIDVPAGLVAWIERETKLGNPALQSAVQETDDPLDILHFPCCNETIKVTRHNHHFCIICGTEIDMTTSDSKKVFLSHKGVDKHDVIDFKKSLLESSNSRCRVATLGEPCKISRIFDNSSPRRISEWLAG